MPNNLDYKNAVIRPYPPRLPVAPSSHRTDRAHDLKRDRRSELPADARVDVAPPREAAAAALAAA